MPRKGPPKPVPEGYVCRACDKPGHWVFDCALKTKKKSKKKRATVDGAAHTSCEDGTKSDDKKTLDPSDDNYIPPLKRPKSGLSAVANNDPKFRCPTEEDVLLAQQNMPVIRMSTAPLCECGKKARPRKCRKQGSSGFGLMFWWCSKARTDETRCRFVKKFEA